MEHCASETEAAIYGPLCCRTKGHTPFISRQMPFISAYVTFCEDVHRNAANSLNIKRIVERFADTKPPFDIDSSLRNSLKLLFGRGIK